MLLYGSEMLGIMQGTDEKKGEVRNEFPHSGRRIQNDEP
jgi:hypothetical protein